MENDNPFDKIKDIDTWFKGKVDKQDGPASPVVKPLETESAKISLKVKGLVVSQTLASPNEVYSYIRITDDNKDGFIVTAKEFYIASTLQNSPSLNSKIEVTVTW